MLESNAVNGFLCKHIPSLAPFCITCKVANSNSKPHQSYDPHKSYKIGELISGDYKGPLDTPCIQRGIRGMFVLHDHGSGHTRCYLVAGKADQMESFIEYRAWFENLADCKIRAFRHDRGTEYTNHAFQKYLKDNQIENQSTASYSPESNAAAESQIRILDRIAKAQIIHAGLGKNYYLLAIEAGCYIRNRLKTTNSELTPHELLTKEKPRIDHLKIFGCRAVLHLPKTLRRSGDPSGKICRFVGYGAQSLTYKLYDGKNFKFIESRDVDFDERCFQFSYSDIHATSNDVQDGNIWFHFSDEDNSIPTAPCEAPASETPVPDGADSGSNESSFHDPQTPSSESEYGTPNGSPSRITMRAAKCLESNLGSAWAAPVGKRGTSRIFTEEESNYTSVCEEEYACLQTEGIALVSKIPKSPRVAIDMPKWKKAMTIELEALKKFNTWDVVKISSVPQNELIFDTTWIYALKRDFKNQVVEKARLCVRGDQEKKDLDLIEQFFAGVARIENFKILLIIAITLGWRITLVDVKNAFVNAFLKKPAFVKIPFGMDGYNRAEYCLRLVKALYGLRDSPAAWSDELTACLIALGFTKCKSDWNLYVRKTAGVTTFLAYHVDDGLFVCSSTEVLEKLLDDMKSKYELKIQHNPVTILGIDVQYDRANHRLFLSQTSYIQTAALKFKVETSRPYSTPMEAGFASFAQSEDVTLPKDTPYRGIIGTLLHVSRMSRPDILFSVNLLARKMAAPMVKHWNAAKRILSYLYHTRNHSIQLGGQRNLEMTCYSDSTWGDDPTNGLSRTGGVLFFGGTVLACWTSQQVTVALSSTEAEYQAFTLAVQQILYYRQILFELGFMQSGATVLKGDNKGALSLAVTTKDHSRSKHINIKHHFIRDCVKDGTIKLEYVSTELQLADIFTKPLGVSKFQFFREKLLIQARGVLEAI